LIEVPFHWTAGIRHYLAVLHPRQAADRLGGVHLGEEIEQQLFAVTATDEIDFRTLEFDEAGIQTGEHPAEGELDRGVGDADLTGENLCIRIAGRTQEAEADEHRFLFFYFLNNDVVGRIRVRLIEHHTVVSRSFQH
jgi:hypothetical protein